MLDYRLGRLKGQFVVVWEEGGRRRRYRLGTREPREARATLREFIKRRDTLDGQGARTRTQSIEAIWNDYIEDRKAEGKSVSRMDDAWKRLAHTFANMGTSDVTPSVVRAYTAGRRANGASDGTIHVELGYLRAALRKALKGKAPAVQLPPKPRPRTRYLTPEEARKLIGEIKMRDIVELEKERSLAKIIMENVGMRNTAGLSAEDRITLDIEWQRAMDRYQRAEMEYQSAIRLASGMFGNALRI